MKSSNMFFIAILLVIILLGNYLREFNYGLVPHPGEIADEYSYGWAGLSLIKDKYPISWSSLNSYKTTEDKKINVDEIYDKDPQRPPFPIVKPWFDHPPLLGLTTGGYAYLKGVREYQDASVAILRRPMLKIAILTTILIFILGWRLYSPGVGLLSALLYSTIPTTLISSRLALMENVIIPLFLGSLIFADLYIKHKKKLYWLIALVFCSVAMLFKLSAVAIGISLILIALYAGKKGKRFLVTSSVFAIIMPLLIFIIYGAYYDWNVFVDTLAKNSQRFYGAGAEIFLSAVAGSRFTTTKFLTDGWIILGWISLFSVSLSEWNKTKGGTILTIAALSYLVVFILFGSESYGWYKFPFFPFIILATSKLLVNLFETQNLFTFVGLLLLPFGSQVHRLLGIMEFQKYAHLLRYFSIIVLGLFGLNLVWNKKLVLLNKIFMVTILGFVVWLSVKEILYLNTDRWYFVT
mgnify:CR=1 FL=1